MMSTPQPDTIEKFRPNNQNFDNPGQNRPLEQRDYSNNNNQYNEKTTRSPY